MHIEFDKFPLSHQRVDPGGHNRRCAPVKLFQGTHKSYESGGLCPASTRRGLERRSLASACGHCPSRLLGCGQIHFLWLSRPETTAGHSVLAELGALCDELGTVWT